MRVLLIGSSFSAVPMLRALKLRGAHVTVMGKYGADPCHAYSDCSIYDDYSNRDTLLGICRKNEFDYIVPSCNDYSYLAAAYVAARLGFAGLDDLETTSILHTKDQFRRFCRQIGVPAPRIFGELTPDGDMEVHGFEGPALVKPVDSFSGRGVQHIERADELPSAARRAFAQSRSRKAVVERFVDGTLHSHTAFIASGRVVWHDFVDEFCEIYPYQVDRSIYPSRLSIETRSRAHASVEKIVSALDICDGLLHTQFIASETEFWIVECMRRCPGDLYGHHFKLALDYDYEANYVAGFVGAEPEGPRDCGVSRHVERRVISTDSEEAFFGVSLTSASANALYVPLKNSGDRLEAAPFDKAGILFLTSGPDMGGQSKTPASLIESYQGILAPPPTKPPSNGENDVQPQDTPKLTLEVVTADWPTCKSDRAKHLCREFLETPASKRFVFGQNVYTEALTQQVAVAGVVDDFDEENQGAVIPIVRTKDLPGDAFVLAASGGRPLTVRKLLAECGIRQIDYFAFQKMSGLELPEAVFNEDFAATFEANRDKAEWLYQRLADDISRETFVKLMGFRLSHDIDWLEGFTERQTEQYFEDFLDPRRGDPVFVDVGGYDGFTAEEFIRRSPGYRAVIVFEPEPENFETCKTRLAGHRDVTILPHGASDRNVTLRFSAKGSVSSLRDDGELEVDVCRIDDIVDIPPTFIKMDIEGAELSAIDGAKKTIAVHRPALALCVYHRPSDFWDIPWKVLSIAPDYSLYLRHYTESIYETVMYFVPHEGI